jgi:putative ABC transport system permease protein
MGQDLGYTLRTLLKQRYFTATAVAVLALGIGLNTALFALINSLLFRPIAAHEPDRLRFLYLTDPGVPDFASGIRLGDYLDLVERRDVFVDLAARSVDQGQFRAGGEVFHARGEMVSGNYFDLLGVRPLHGRGIGPGDDDPAAERVVVVSEDLWRARLGADPGAIGTSVRIDDSTYTVAGVMPRWFRGTLGPWEHAQYWAPLGQRALEFRCRATPTAERSVTVIGRLPPGGSTASVQAALGGVRLAPTSWPAAGKPENLLWSVTVFDAARASLPFIGFTRVVPERLSLAVLALGGLVLVIGALNLTGTLAARGVARRTEIATRLALGASRWRIGRQMFTESLVLCVAGGVLGLIVAQWLTSIFTVAVPSEFRPFSLVDTAPSQVLSIDAAVDRRVLGFTFGASVLAALMTGLLPALRASRNGVLGTLTNAAGGVARVDGRRLRGLVVIPQVCLSLALLVLAGTLVANASRMARMDQGYDPTAIVFVGFEPPTPPWRCERRQPTEAESAAYRDARGAFHRRVLAAASTLPGVAHASLAWSLPHVGPRSGGSWIRGLEPRHDGTMPVAYITRVGATAGYFRVLGIPILHGRSFDQLEDANDANVAVLSEDLARALWGDRNPLGRRVAFSEPSSSYPPVWHEVIGVVPDVRSPLSEGGRDRPTAYVPLGRDFAMTLAVRGPGAPHDLTTRLKTILADADPSLRLGEGGTAQDAIDAYLYPRRLAAGVLMVAGLVGLLLASIGIYGVVSYSVAQRVREFGVRIALGAARGDIIRLIASEGGRTAVIGMVLGIALGYGAVRLASRYVVAMPSLDPVTLAGAPAVIAAIVLVACYIPARRAARVDPIVALRDL